MNRKDLGKYLSNFFNFGSFGERVIKPLLYKKAPPTPFRRHKRIIHNVSGIPTTQEIRMAQNKRNGIELKKRIARKKMLLFKREEKNKWAEK